MDVPAEVSGHRSVWQWALIQCRPCLAVVGIHKMEEMASRLVLVAVGRSWQGQVSKALGVFDATNCPSLSWLAQWLGPADLRLEKSTRAYLCAALLTAVSVMSSYSRKCFHGCQRVWFPACLCPHRSWATVSLLP